MRVGEFNTNRWIDQRLLDYPRRPLAGDCVEACIASILHIDRDVVPDLRQAGETDYHYWNSLNNFMRSRGFVMIRKEAKYKHPGLHLVMGRHADGHKCMVIHSGEDLVHDPHPSRKGLSWIDTVWLLVPMDPSVVLL